MLPTSLVTWLGTLAGRFCVGAGLVATIAGLWFGWLWHHDNKVIASHDAKIEQRTTQNVDKANAARKSVENLPLDKLDDQFRRD